VGRAHGKHQPRQSRSQSHERYTITQLSRLLLTPSVLVFAGIAAFADSPLHAQEAQGAFAKGRWHAEFITQAALEAWNYNPSHEEIYGLVQGITYGLRDGLVLTARQRLYYVSQRRNDSRVLGLTATLRGRV
jgi:hypothetical protein